MIQILLKKYSCLLMLIVAIAIIAPNCLESDAAIYKVKLAAFSYPPFYYKENGSVKGIAVDLTRELFKRMKIKTSIRIYPLARALRRLENGQNDALMILIKTPDRSKYLSFTRPIVTARGFFWSSVRNNIDINKLDEIENYSIGVTRGYSYGVELDSILKRIGHASVVDSDLQNFQMLDIGRIDVFPCNEIVASSLFKKYPELKGKFIASNKSFIDWILHMGISKKSALVKRLPEINRIITSLKRENFIQNTISRYVD